MGDIGTGYLGLVRTLLELEFLYRNIREKTVAETMAKFLNDGAVELYQILTIKKFETISTGCSITGELRVSDDITAFYSSDERLKDNILPIDDALTKVMKIGGYTYNWNEESGKKGPDVGVIAQEVDMIGLPGIATTRDNGYMAVNYEKLVPLLVQSVRELNGKVDRMKQKIKSLEQQLSDK